MRTDKQRMYPELAVFIAEVEREGGTIPANRRELLLGLADLIARRTRTGEPARLVFICTHNSRRSHLAQIWAQTAAHHFGVAGVETYSGGTEATAFNPRAAAALQRAGFRIDTARAGPNPVYAVSYAPGVPPMECFSKVYREPPNPAAGFCAVMTCDAADQGCPVVLGASARVAIPYHDPKAFDATDQEAAAYDRSCRQIAREMLFAMAQVAGS